MPICPQVGPALRDFQGSWPRKLQEAPLELRVGDLGGYKSVSRDVFDIEMERMDM